jgi:hypothetical protein
MLRLGWKQVLLAQANIPGTPLHNVTAVTKLSVSMSHDSVSTRMGESLSHTTAVLILTLLPDRHGSQSRDT